MKPSFLSFLAGTIAAAGLLFIANAPYILGSELLSSMLGTEPSQVSLLFAQLHTNLNSDRPQLDMSFLDLPIVYNIVIIFAAIVAGILVYISLETVTRGMRGARNSIAEIKFAKTATVKTALGLEFSARLALRLGAVIGWVTYAAFWLGVVLPYAILVSRLGLSETSLFTASLYIFDGLILLGLSIHLHVIFVRLFLLRPRIFGNRSMATETSYMKIS